MRERYLVLAISSGAVGALSACLGKIAGAVEQGKWWLQPLLYCLMVLVRVSGVLKPYERNEIVLCVHL